MLTIIGGCSKRRERRIKQTVYYCLMHGLQITQPLAIVLTDLKDKGVLGYCSMPALGLVVEIESSLRGVDFSAVLLHELKHAEQYSTGKLAVIGNVWHWKGRPITESYSRCPAELAANRYAIKMSSVFHPASE